ncbi:hypothetical protein OO007_12075 [Cocleimonas sp. KMM 6892]|uniref:hypothetical protein n=1 Tax=unclassified Cocleimonas TaxID=2639732 RepID=UPI002DB82187|nr:MULTISPECIES: hypothetical protein [unclassified Cocleimonas]MEB8432966.1 hypothetical protein [Cocleimonas sp. KMM 6892]MEC4716053.1 hypothetical protein [Cocleimonas sp. KMM 6895]MEC4745514.1 hypothetical protein [Cocleimonas sp. KMM 6896]
MLINNKKIKGIKNGHILGIFLSALLISACNNDDSSADSDSHTAKPQSLLSTSVNSTTDHSSNSTSNNSEKDAEKHNDPNEIKTWHGQDFGFVSEDHPAINKIEALIALGKINAATISYRNTSTFLSSQASDSDVNLWSNHAAASINEDVLAIYDSLELVFRNNNIKPFKESLEQLAKPETIEIYTRNSNDNSIRQQKNEITQASRIISASISNAISVLEPSRKEYILAGSVMLNESGKNLQEALSKDGMITNPSKHQLGISQIDGALSLIPKFAIDQCEKQRQISQAYRDNTNEIVEQLTSFDNKPAQADVNDIYALAKKTEDMAKTLPEKDLDICK